MLLDSGASWPALRPLGPLAALLPSSYLAGPWLGVVVVRFSARPPRYWLLPLLRRRACSRGRRGDTSDPETLPLAVPDKAERRRSTVRRFVG